MSKLRRNNSEVQEKASFKKLSDNLRRLTPLEIQCHVFCGGKKCKYEGPHAWTPDQMALHGVFSHWVTCNILAMARPNTDVMENFDLIGQFKRKGIRTLINLQQPGEHAHCGKSLDPSGFSYSPDIFMKNGIYFYNFGWKDYQVGHLEAITDIVKVMAFSLQEGKIAIHCHAGLGRTGVLIACFLIYWCRISANQAIHYVRLKRPNSIQSEAQVECVNHFAQHILPNFTVFSKGGFGDFTLLEFLHRQETVLHGEDARTFKYLPKVVFQLCERLLQLSKCDPVGTVIEESDQSTGVRQRAFWHRFLALQPGGSPATTPTDKETMNFFAQDRLAAGWTLLDADNTVPLEISNKSEEEGSAQVLQPIDKSSFVQDEGSGSNVVARKETGSNNNTANSDSKIDNSSTSSVVQEQTCVEENKNSSMDFKPQVSTLVSSSLSPTHPQTPSLNTPTIVIPKSDDIHEDVFVSPASFLANRRRSVSANDLTEFIGNSVSPLLLGEPPGSPYVTMRPSSRAIEEDNNAILALTASEVPDLQVEELFYKTQLHLVKKNQELKGSRGLSTAEDVAVALSDVNDENTATFQVQHMVAELQGQVDLTPEGMSIIPDLDNIHVLARLLHVWLRQLKQPILSKQEVTRLGPFSDDPAVALHKLDKGTRVTVEYILRFITHLKPLDEDRRNMVLTTLLRSLTHLQPVTKEVEKTTTRDSTRHVPSYTPSKMGHLEIAMTFSRKLLPLLTNELPS